MATIVGKLITALAVSEVHTGRMDGGRLDKLRAEVRDIAWELDPAGIGGEADWPRDEYDAYVDGAVSSLMTRGVEAAAARLAE
ncbi:hypothetical protein [Conyzicola sp.]|uniref:hypothetical protein n=1 Tax=Conyzicola sp. TaxID=1969404 RepID=UPI0039891F4E